MEPTVLHAGEGERLDAEHVIKVSSSELDVLEFTVGRDFEGPGPHYHARHVDSFYVLEGELELTAGADTLRAGPGTSVSVPPRVVHSFTNAGPGGARFLNFHTPGGFSEYARARSRGEQPDPAVFDQHNVDAHEGPGAAIVAPLGAGERLDLRDLVITIRTDRPEIALLDFTIEPTWSGVGPHHHDDHVDSFFVLWARSSISSAGRPSSPVRERSSRYQSGSRTASEARRRRHGS
jgi:quercetin dioxygenase-like cupin family protein